MPTRRSYLNMFQKGSALVLVTGVALVAAVSAFGGSSAQQATTVTVMAGMPEFGLKLSKKTVPKGVVTFKVTNMGSLPHDFKIFGKKTPLLKSGKSATFKVTFKKAGKYPYLCTVAGHAAAGMKGRLIVK